LAGSLEDEILIQMFSHHKQIPTYPQKGTSHSCDNWQLPVLPNRTDLKRIMAVGHAEFNNDDTASMSVMVK